MFADEKRTDTAPRANLSAKARAYLSSLGITAPDSAPGAGTLIWLHALAVGYSPAYLSENRDGIRQDWPRIPMPRDRQLLEASADLGRQLAALLDVECPAESVTTGALRPEIARIGTVSAVGRARLNPDQGDLAVTVGWGRPGKGGIVTAGRGKIEVRAYSADELNALQQGASRLDLTLDQALACLGGATCDVYLNGVAYWRNIPERVWGYTIGGYQVLKKWLTYRERTLLGRPLAPAEAREVTNMARRLAAVLLLEPALDSNYEQVKAGNYSWELIAAATAIPQSSTA